jgi:hypothetical protein
VFLREEVARRFSVEVHESTIGKWLRHLEGTTVALTREKRSPLSSALNDSVLTRCDLTGYIVARPVAFIPQVDAIAGG